MKVGEPAKITVYVFSKIDCDISIELINPLVTVPYDMVSGPSEIEEFIDFYSVKSGWSENITSKGR